MGKSKSKKSKTKRNSRYQPYDTRFNDSMASQYSNKGNTFLHDISSLEENKRRKAIKILGHLYAINTNNIVTIHKLSQPDILSKLNMKLLDVSVSIRIETAGAVKNLALCTDEDVLNRIHDSGIFKTVLMQCLDSLNSNQYSYMEQLLLIVCNLISGSDTFFVEMTQSLNILQLAATIIFQDSIELISLRLAAANLLLITTDSNKLICEMIISQVAYFDQIFSTICAINNVTNIDSQNDIRLFNLRCCGILINIFLAVPDRQHLLLKICHIHSIFDHLILSLRPSHEMIMKLISDNIPVDPVFIDDATDDLIDAAKEDFTDNADDMESFCISENKGDSGLKSTHAFVNLEVIKLASELLANLASSLQMDSEESLVSDDDESDETIANDMDIADSSPNGENTFEETQLELQELIVSKNVLNKLTSTITAIFQPMLEIVNNLPKQSITNSLIYLLDAVDTVIMAATNIICTNSFDIRNIESTIVIFLDLADFIFDAVNNTCKSVDAEGNHSQIWPIHSTVNYSSLLGCVNATAISISQTLTSLSSYTNQSSEYFQRFSLILMKGVMLPVMEVSVACIESIGRISVHHQLLQNINAVFTNCILRRMDQPSSVSCEGKSRELCPIYVVDACVMAIIDLHSSDDIGYFKVYQSFETNRKLSSSLNILKAKLKEPLPGSVKSEKRKFRETLSNGFRFIKYKDEFSNSI